MKTFTYTELRETASNEIMGGVKGWIKAKCLDKNCNTITIWNSARTGVKCAEGTCAKCGGPVARTVWSVTAKYIIKA